MSATVVALWLWLFRGVYDYLAIVFSREDFRTSQLVLIGAIGLVAMRARHEHWRLGGDGRPRLATVPLILVLASAALYLLAERFLGIATVSALLFGLGAYGLVGLWLEPRRWRQGFPAAVVLIGALPFGDHAQTFVGYPMRLLTAEAVRDGLAAAGIASVGVDTILRVENGVSQVDLPCSGVKSLWTGALFLFAATWIERRPFNARWTLVALIFALLLFGANLARVAILVVVGQVMAWQQAAEMLHVPLGVLAFVGVCAAALGLLRIAGPPRTVDDLREARQAGRVRSSPVWLGPVLAGAFLLLGLFHTTRPHTGLAASPPLWSFPSELATTALPLKPEEVTWLTRDGAESADRRRFAWQGIHGTMTLVLSTSWRAHHRPERCFEVHGLQVHDSRTYLVAPDFPVRIVGVGDRGGEARLSAAYWFQTADRITDDYATRLWADMMPSPQQWVLVSVLLDDAYEPDEPRLKGLYQTLRRTIQQQFDGPTSTEVPA